MKKWFLLLIQVLVVSFLYGNEYYVATNGSNENTGNIANPFGSLQYAIAQVDTGDVIYLREGTYNETITITILAGNNGTPTNLNKIYAYNNETVILDFSTMIENSSNRGIRLYGNYWHINGLIIQDAGDNGMSIGGNHNIVENCIFRRNHDTGLQLSRISSAFTDIADWPSYNLILNCESYDNSDSDHEDADGFAAKLTCGPGNVFQNCIAHHNIDDGWDLYTKTETGPIGEVSLIECIAHSNGSLTDGSTSGNGDKNGFKLGGEDIAVNHIVRRCVAFNNGKHGFTYNRNLGTIKITNCTSYNNSQRNYTFDGGTSVFTNNISYLSTSNDKIIGTDMGSNVWDNDDTPIYTITDNDFVSMVPGDNNAPYNSGFLQLKEGSQLIDKGDIVDGIAYEGVAPDLGAFEYGSAIFQKKYILNYSITDNRGGSVEISPKQDLYDSATVVTLRAIPDVDYTFSGWTGAYTGTDTLIELTMNENKFLTASFTTDKLALNVTSSGPGTIAIDPTLEFYTKGTTITLTATADDGCYFIGWSGDTISELNSLSFTLEEDMNIRGMFQKEPVKEIIFQFESSEICEADGKFDNKHAGYKGTGFWDFTNAVGAATNISVDAKDSTSCELTVRYAHGKDDLRPMGIKVNGISQHSSIAFPSTGAFTTWDSVSFAIKLQKGNNRIDFFSLESEGGTNFDQVRLSTSEAFISKGYCSDNPPPATEEFTLTLNVSPLNSGEVTTNPKGIVFEAGTLVSLTAVADEGYHFVNWSNGLDIATISITMNSNTSFIANFEEDTIPGGTYTFASTSNSGLSMRVFPNPVFDYSKLELSSEKQSYATLFLIDITGKKYTLFKGLIIAGNTIINIDANAYEKGIYVAEVRTDNQIIQKIILIN